MYSHDTFGLGHIRRTLLIAGSLAQEFSDLSILILTGSSMIHTMRIPEKADYIKLPCLTKLSNDRYVSKYLGAHSARVRKLRREIIFKTIKEYDPDFLLVDKAPIGVMGELLEALLYMRLKKPGARTILGIRDILDHPQAVKEDWRKNHIYEVLEMLYDDIWVYGSKEITDVAKEYELPRTVNDKLHFCGYLRRQGPFADPRQVKERLGARDKKLLLVTLGGGGDGHDLLKVFFRTVSAGLEGIRTLVVTGPDFPSRKLAALSQAESANKEITIVDYTEDLLDYMNAADVVISMAGYNTVCEIVSLSKKAIVVPRTFPRREQLIRAQKFSEKGLLTMVHPSGLTPESLRNEVMRALSEDRERCRSSEVIDLNGLENVKKRFGELCRTPSFQLSPARKGLDISLATGLAPSNAGAGI